MVQDPYKILGVQRGASKDEIKKAYRKKAKECHPDFHPDDPKASEKMNEVNEAYDMLMNPEKYSARQEQEQRRQSYSNPYGSYGQGGSNYGYGSGYGSYGQNSSHSGGYRGAGGWYSDFGGFDFNEFFGGAYSASANTAPVHETGDSQEFRDAIYAINGNRFRDALNILSQVRSGGRNARFYYLCGLAYNGSGNRSQAVECMTRAVQMDPNNSVYHTLLNRYRQNEQTADRSQTYYPMQTGCSGSLIGRILIFFVIIQIILRLFTCGFVW